MLAENGQTPNGGSDTAGSPARRLLGFGILAAAQRQGKYQAQLWTNTISGEHSDDDTLLNFGSLGLAVGKTDNLL